MAKTLAQMKAEIDELLQKRSQIDELILLIAPLKTLQERLSRIPIDADKIGVDQLDATLEQVREGTTDIKGLFRQLYGETASRRTHPGGEKRTRQPRRTKAQIEYDAKIASIQKDIKAKLELPARGRLSAEQQEKLDKELEKEIKKQKLVAPSAG